MPIPVSLTAICTPASVAKAATEIRPPSGVNFTALDSRLSRICLTLRSSPAKEFRRVSISTFSAMPCRFARSRTKAIALSMVVGRSKLATASSMRPASTLDRSRISLISESR